MQFSCFQLHPQPYNQLTLYATFYLEQQVWIPSSLEPSHPVQVLYCAQVKYFRLCQYPFYRFLDTWCVVFCYPCLCHWLDRIYWSLCSWSVLHTSLHSTSVLGQTQETRQKLVTMETAEKRGQYTIGVKERLEGYFGVLREPARENKHLKELSGEVECGMKTNLKL